MKAQRCRQGVMGAISERKLAKLTASLERFPSSNITHTADVPNLKGKTNDCCSV